MEHDYYNLAWGILTLFFVCVCILFLVWWRGKTANGGSTPLQGRRVEAEILDAATTPQEKRCKACGATSSLAGWRRSSTLEVMGGVVGWSRRVRGLPPLYTRTRPNFSIEDLCAECSHVRDSRNDKKVMEVNLAILTVGEQIAIEVQRFNVSIDDDVKEAVAAADPRSRRLRASNSLGGR